MDRFVVGAVALIVTLFVGDPELASGWSSIGVVLEGRSVFETSSPLFTYLVSQIATGLDISLLSAAFYTNAVCFAAAVSFMHCWSITQTSSRFGALQLTALMAITPVIGLGSIAVPGHGLALACTAMAFWLVSRNSRALSTNHAAMAGVAMLVGVLAHHTAIFAPVGVLGWMLIRGRVPSFEAMIAMFVLPAAYMVLGSSWSMEHSLAPGDVDLVGSLQTEWLRPFMPLSLVLCLLLFRKSHRIASAVVLLMVGGLAVVTTGTGGSGMGMAVLLWPTAHIAYNGLGIPGRNAIVLLGAVVASLALSPRLPEHLAPTYSDAIASRYGNGAMTMLSLGQPQEEVRACAERRGARILSLDTLLSSETDGINDRVADFDMDVRDRLARGEHVILGVSTTEVLLLASRKESMGAGFVEYLTKHYAVHFTVVDGFKLVELTDGSAEPMGDTQVLTLDPPPPPSDP